MKMTVVATIPQVGGGVRYLLDSNHRAAQSNIAIIRETGLYDAASPAYIVDVEQGKRSASRFPGQTMSADEWAAIRAAIHA